MSTDGPAVRLRRLTKRYGARVALSGIDLDLDGREIVGVVGPDGAGKTTLLRSLGGLLEVEAEEATVLGHDLRADPTALKAELGYVPQAFGLQRELSIDENLGFTARLHRLAEDVFRERADALLGRTGLAAFRDRPAGQLSGGMKQKLAIANALLVRPRLILLDEPTAGVDVVARAEIWEMLEREKERALVVVSTSYLDEASAVDRLVYLDGGRLVADGSPEALRARTATRLYRVWGESPRRIADASRRLAWVVGARASGRFARVDARVGEVPPARALDDLRRLPGVAFVERIAVDMEAALVALARGADSGGPRAVA